MTPNDISQIISTVGFPIFACCVMFYQQGKMQQTLNNVNLTMQSLVDRIESIETSRGGDSTGNN